MGITGGSRATWARCCLYLDMFLEGSSSSWRSANILICFLNRIPFVQHLRHSRSPAYPGTLSHECVNLRTAGFSSPLIIANMELKLRKSLHCLAILMNFLMSFALR